MDRQATCSRDGCLSTDYEERIAELEEQLRNQAALHRRIAELHAENAKLEAALQRITQTHGSDAAIRIATKALEGEQNG